MRLSVVARRPEAHVKQKLPSQALFLLLAGHCTAAYGQEENIEFCGNSYATDTTSVSCASDSLTDLSPLTGMTKLTALDLNRTGVTDLSPLAGLTGLEGLFLSSTGVTDLSPLAGLTGLKVLDLRDTEVSWAQVEKLKVALPACKIAE